RRQGCACRRPTAPGRPRSWSAGTGAPSGWPWKKAANNPNHRTSALTLGGQVPLGSWLTAAARCGHSGGPWPSDLEDVPLLRDRTPRPAGAAGDLAIGQLAQQRQLLLRPRAAVGPRRRPQSQFAGRAPPALDLLLGVSA